MDLAENIDKQVQETESEGLKAHSILSEVGSDYESGSRGEEVTDAGELRLRSGGDEIRVWHNNY